MNSKQLLKPLSDPNQQNPPRAGGALPRHK